MNSVEQTAKDLDAIIQPFIGQILSDELIDLLREQVLERFARPEYSVTIRRHTLITDKVVIGLIDQELEELNIII